MKTSWRVGLSSVVISTVLACGGGPAVCEKSDALDLSKKAGDCVALDLVNPVGSRATCPDKVKPCSKTEQDTLQSMVTCLENLPVCSMAAKDTFVARQGACFASAPGLSDACRTSVFGSVIPGQDGGMDGGPYVDAGHQPITDGGAVVDFVAVADETGFAFGWSSQQAGTVAKWELNVFEGDGGRLPEIYITPGSSRAHELAGLVAVDSGIVLARRFFIAGVDNANFIVFGEAPDAGTVVSDAGSTCVLATSCAPDKVCDLGTCKTQTCQPGGAATCPPGYDCFPNGTCNRQFSDAGTIDAGLSTDGGAFTPMPLVSNLVSVVTGVPGISAGVSVGGFSARRPDLVAIDSARQFISVEQESQPFGHYTVRRGKELINDFGSTAPIDTVGTRVRLAYVPESDTVYACYGVGRGVRVRRSRDLGKSWGTSAATIEPVEDGGFSSRMTDCDIAPWKNGAAIMSYVEDDAVVVQVINETLALVGPPEYAFFGSPADAGNIYNPVHTAIATLPGDSIVHVGFTATRAVGGISDTEIYGLYRDGTTGTFLPATVVNYKSGGGGTAGAQDNVTIAVDPKTKKAVAAFGSVEAAGGYNTVYVSIFNPTSKTWITGSDLTVFAKDPVGTLFYNFPSKSVADTWDAFSPSLAVTKAGKIFLSVVAGIRAGGGNDFKMYLVGFDFDAQSPIGGKGWFRPPAVKMSDSRVLDPRTGTSSVPPTVSSITTDSQLSVYGVFIEGIGQFGEMENRAVYVSRP